MKPLDYWRSKGVQVALAAPTARPRKGLSVLPSRTSARLLEAARGRPLTLERAKQIAPQKGYAATYLRKLEKAGLLESKPGKVVVLEIVVKRRVELKEWALTEKGLKAI